MARPTRVTGVAPITAAPPPPRTEGKLVAYYRVSTAKQGSSGLGLEAQREAVQGYLSGGGSWRLVGEVVEVESGKRSDRPKLAEALRLCRLHGATLIIAKLDRLARNVAFVSNLMESGVEFTAVDFPQANRLTVHILAAVAEHEAQMISARTKAALAAAKARGTRLGGHRGVLPSDEHRAAGRATQSQRAEARALDLAPILAALREHGEGSLVALARGLNERGIPAPRGGRWTPIQVSRVLARLGNAGGAAAATLASA
ncbi:recombinase family protein [Enterovirga sp.]|uniref:recombinase family protein n=1 Tax=Enterovirga sp. TaxID=2026350 RepID=UPI002C73EF09|nr:recombinase family protein [Enterovirga sp.]HMO29948.1 recombinase family protein [Enterovirga sp.]